MASFIYPVKYHVKSGTGQFGAPYVSSLTVTNVPLVCVLDSNEGNAVPGMYHNTGAESVPWKPAIPIEDMSKAIVNGDSIELFYNLDAEASIPDNAILYRNGVIIENQGTIPAQDTSIYAIRVPKAVGGSGDVDSVNGKTPDADGNVQLTAADVGAASTSDLVVKLDKVDTVNTVYTVDSSGEQASITGTEGQVLAMTADGLDFVTPTGGTSDQAAVLAVDLSIFDTLPLSTYDNGPANDGVGATLTVSTSFNVSVNGFTLPFEALPAGGRYAIANGAVQSDSSNNIVNGIYSKTSGTGVVPIVLTRTTDYDTSEKVQRGTFFLSPANSGSGVTDTTATRVLRSNMVAGGIIGTDFLPFEFDEFSSGGGSGSDLVLQPADLINVADDSVNGIYYNGPADDGVGATYTFTVDGSTPAPGSFTLDGTTVDLGMRVIINTGQPEDGVYLCTTAGDGTTPSVLTRATDNDSADKIKKGQLIAIIQGNTRYGAIFSNITDGTIVVGTTILNFQASDVPQPPGGNFVAPEVQQVQYNKNGVFTGADTFFYTESTDTLTVTNVDLTGTLKAGANTGTSGQVLTSNGDGVAPTWQDGGGYSLPTASATVLGGVKVGEGLSIDGVGALRSDIAPTGTTGQLQYNNAGALGAVSDGIAGQVLTSAGAGQVPTWEDASLPVIGANTEIIFNNNGVLDGSPDFKYDPTSNSVTLGSSSTTTAASLVTAQGTGNVGRALNISTSGAGNGAGGNLVISTGNGAGSTSGGNISLLAGTSAGGDGGNIVIRAGDRGASGGTTTIKGGNSSSAAGGDVVIAGGDSSATHAGGSVVISTAPTNSAQVERFTVDASGAWSLGAAGVGTSGQVLTSQGSGQPPIWVTASGGGGTPAGTTGQIQYNNAGAFGAISNGTAGQGLLSQGAGQPPVWGTPVSGPGGADTQIQVNRSGVLSGNANFTWSDSSGTLSLGNVADNSAVTMTTTISSGGDSRSITLTSKTPTSGNGNGGNINIIAGVSTGTGTPGSILIRGANSNVSGAGDTNITGGQLNSSAAAGTGNVNIYGGTATVTTVQAGNVTISGGLGSGVGAGGDIVLSTGPTGNSGLSERFRVRNNGAWSLGAAGNGTAGQALLSQGSSSPPIWGNPSVTASPGGSDKQIQVNRSGALSGNANFTWDDSAVTLGLGNTANSINASITTILASDGTSRGLSLKPATGTATNAGGQVVNISGGNGNGAGVGGNLLLSGGTAGASAGGNVAGDVIISGGNANSQSTAGLVTIQGGTIAGGNSNNTGYVAISGGSSSNASYAGGNLNLNGGLGSTTGIGGDIVISTSTTGSSGRLERIRVKNTGAVSLGTSGTATGTNNQVMASQGSANPPQWISIPYDVSGTIFGKPSAGDTVQRFVAVRAFSVAASLAGSTAKCDAAPTASVTITFYKNGSSFGSVTFGAGATTGAFSGTATTFNTGDVITAVAPAVADATFGNCAFTIAGVMV